MLVLSRKENERIRLGDSIVVTVVRLSGDKVRLGIEAPANIVVLRDELESHPPAPSIVNACGAACTERSLATQPDSPAPSA